MTKFVWLQSAVSSKKLEILKIRGEDNPAELLTKRKTSADIVFKAGLTEPSLMKWLKHHRAV